MSFDNANKFIQLGMVPPLARVVAEAIDDPSGVVSPTMFGARGDGVSNDTFSILAMFATHPVYIDWGDSSKTYRISKPLVLNWKSTWIGRGAKIFYDWTVDGFTQNMLRVEPGGEFSVVDGLVFDHNSDNAIMPYMHSGQDLFILDAIRSTANNVTFRNCVVYRSGTNGIGLGGGPIVSGNGTTGSRFTTAITPFLPTENIVDGCRFEFCGYIDQSDASKFDIPPAPDILAKGGAGGFDILSASRSIVNNCVSFRCSMGFVVDVGAGAVSNTISNITIVGAGAEYPLASSIGNGWGAWVGSSQNSFSNIQILASIKTQFIVDPRAINCTFTNITATNGQTGGFLISGNDNAFTNCMAIQNGLLTPNTYDGFMLSAQGTITGITMVNCHASSLTNSQRYGLNVSGAGTITGRAGFCNFTGQTGATNLGSYGFTVT